VSVLESVPTTATATTPTTVRISGSTFSLRVIAASIILLFCYYAQGVVITLLLSILIAYFLDPAVELLERARIPRTIGAMVMVLILIAFLVAIGYGMGTRTADFAENWPKYSSVLKNAASAVEGKISGIEGRVENPGTPANPVRSTQSFWKSPSCPSWYFLCWRGNAKSGTERSSCFR
jgi:predicted PurR-regulated permease PerM